MKQFVYYYLWVDGLRASSSWLMGWFCPASRQLNRPALYWFLNNKHILAPQFLQHMVCFCEPSLLFCLKDAHLRTMWRVTGDSISINVLQLLSDLFIVFFVKSEGIVPFHFSYRMLISFTKQKGAPDWWGYSLAFLMFFTALLQTLILHRHFQYCFVTGMNVRTAVIGAIYRKVCAKLGILEEICFTLRNSSQCSAQFFFCDPLLCRH